MKTTTKIKRSDLEKLSNLELATIAKKLQEIDEANKSRTLESYLETAHDKQIAFHKAPKRIRYFLGGNRSGKTTGGTVEDLWRLLGRHPYRKNKVPCKGLLVLQDFENHCKKIAEPKIMQWAPSGAITGMDRNQTGALRAITFNTGSTLDILSHDQDLKVFEGGDWDFAHFDEPPPKAIFNAVWRGLTDRGGDAYITATPIVGPWMYREFKLAEEGDDLRWCIFVDTEDNAVNLGEGDKALGLKRIEEFASMLNEDEKQARLHGKFLQLQGLILKEWQRGHHLIRPFPWPRDWPIYESIDPHPHKPWAVSWIGITGNEKKILIRSGLYEGVVEEIADQILYERGEIEIQGGGAARISRTLIDNSASVPLWSKSNTDPTARRISVREELENMITPPRIEVAPKNVRQKIDLFKSWLHIKENEEGKLESDFYAFDVPENERFIYEIENYTWDTKKGVEKGLKDQPRKIDDDILDSIMQVALVVRSGMFEPQPIIRTMQGNSWKV